MLFYSFFKTLIGKPITVHLKNDVELGGVLISADQFLNLKLSEVKVAEESKHPHLLAIKTAFIRGSVVRYVEVPKEAVNVELLQDATRVEYMSPASGASTSAPSHSKSKRSTDEAAAGAEDAGENDDGMHSGDEEE